MYEYGSMKNFMCTTMVPVGTDPNDLRSEVREPDVAGVIRRVLRPGDTFVDVGANIGMHSRYAADIVGPTGRVVAVEPGENCLPELRALAFGSPQIEVVPVVMWSHVKEMQFHLCADGSGGNALWPPQDVPDHNPKSKAEPKSYTVKTETIDEMFRGGPVRLIKIDTEGAEQRVLEGGRDLLTGSNRPPYVVSELHQYGLIKLGCHQMTLLSLMQNYGYHAFALDLHDRKPFRIPEGHILGVDYIVNLLFALDPDADKLWSLQ